MPFRHDAGTNDIAFWNPSVNKKKLALGCVIAAAILSTAHLMSSGAYERPDEFSRPSDLDREDCRVGVLSGYDSENVSRKVFPRAQIVGFHEFDDAFMALLAGKIEGFVYSEHVLNVALRAYPHRLKVLDEALSKAPSVVLVSRRRPELLKQLNAFIRNYRKSGFYSDMFTRWCQSDEYVPMPSVPDGRGRAGVLRIGTSGTEEPSSFWDDSGNLAGFDIEFIRRFAQVMDYKAQIVCRPDDEILDELAADQLDIVIDDYNANEVKPGMLASDGYFDSDMKVLVRTSGAAGMMLGSTRLGYGKTLIKDPRVRVFVVGFFTTLALTVLSSFFGFVLALAVLVIRRKAPSFAKGAIDTVQEIVRLLPPPVVILTVSCAILTTASPWVVAVAAFALWYAAFLAEAGDSVASWLRISRVKLVELMQWTSVVGAISLCDLTMAADIVCGRTLAAFGPLLSVAAAYCLMNWIVKHGVRYLEKKLG